MPVVITLHPGSETFGPAMITDIEPANDRDIPQIYWANGMVTSMALELTSGAVELYVYGAVSPYQIDNRTNVTGPITLTSFLQSNSGNPAYVFDQTNCRETSTAQVDMRNCGASYCGFTPYPGFPSQPLLSCAGALQGTGDEHHGAFLVGQNGSGTIGLECKDNGSGCYIPVMSHMSNGSLHGSLTVVNFGSDGGPLYMDGGLLLQLKNGTTNGSTDSQFEVDAFGHFGQPERGLALAQFHPCPDPLAPINEFGNGAASSDFSWAIDTQHWYVCKPGQGGWTEVIDSSRLNVGLNIAIDDYGDSLRFTKYISDGGITHAYLDWEY